MPFALGKRKRIQPIRPLGVQILLNDPPQKEALRKAGKPHEFFLKMEELQEKCDIISFHTPLITKGPYPTFHLANKTFFNALKKQPIIINTSRGAVVDNTDVLQALKDGIIRDAIIDTWENEPNINQELLNLIYIGTPHIAGYSADGKANATRMALTALCNHFHLPVTFQIRVPQLPEEELPEPNLTETERALVLYNPHPDSLKLKSHPTMFEELRGNYPLRREFIE